MTERIKKLVDKTVKGEMFVDPKPTEYDRKDNFLEPIKMSSKRVCEYIDNQDLLILPESRFTGLMKFDGSVEGDVFSRAGHKNNYIAALNFYNSPIDKLVILEFQHSVGDFGKIINRGLIGILDDIEKSKINHKDDKNAIAFLETQTAFCNAVIRRAEKGAKKALKLANETTNPEYKSNLLKLSKSLENVPFKPASSFYEAILSLYFCYTFIPDSIGLIDRYLYPFYKKDIESGALTNQEATEYLQELFLMLQARIDHTSDRFYRGGESHFCIGGYLPDGTDGFNELSKLILEALMDLPTWIPQISLRWTKKTPRDVFKFAMDCERKDPNKRIAFANDESRLAGIIKHSGIPYEKAVSYTMMGCNEIALPGGIISGFDMVNILHSVESTFFNRKNDIINADSFDKFYSIFEDELFNDLTNAKVIIKGLQDIRSRDCNLVSNIFIEGCIENAKSLTQGGCTNSIHATPLIGISNVIDSLAVVKQFVFEEKIITMAELIEALENNWENKEDLRELILKKAKFFGNDDNLSNGIANKLFESINSWNNIANKEGKKWIFGNLIGYNEHHKFFGDITMATPDGRFAGDMLNYGIGQSQNKDRNGITALLNSVAKCDQNNILVGPSVTNVLIDEKLIKDDDNFEKLVDLFLTYFKNGGTHFQLTYVSKEDLIKAKKSPEEYKNLRVRVSGFSDYFIFLNDALQDEIITRTVKKG